jgi:hypothetical protein
MSESKIPEIHEETKSSYARLFDNGSNRELATDIGKMFTHIQSETIKQGNKLEEFIVHFVRSFTTIKVVHEKKGWYKNLNTIEDILHGIEKLTLITKCFIPKTFLDKENLQCGNKTGIELDFVVVLPDKKLILVEMKAGKDFDTKKSKGEVDSMSNVKLLFEKQGITVEKCIFVSYEAKSVGEINFKTDLCGCTKSTFEQFLRLLFDHDDIKVREAKQYIQQRFHEQANQHLDYVYNEMARLLTNKQK